MSNFRQNVEIIALLVGILGVLLNVALVMVTVSRKSNSIDWLLIFMIAILDLMCSLYLGVRVLLLWLDAELASGLALCGLGSVGIMPSMLVTLILTAVLGLVRYLVIVRNVHVKPTYLYPPTFLLCFLVYMLYLARGLTAGAQPLPSRLYCIVEYFGEDPFSRIFGFMNVSLFASAMFVIVACYFSISCTYFATLRQIGNKGHRLYAPVIGLLIVCFMYFTAMLPESFSFLYIQFTGTKRTLELDAFSILPVSFLPIVNAVYTFLLHDETRHKLVTMVTGRLHPRPFDYPNPYQLYET